MPDLQLTRPDGNELLGRRLHSWFWVGAVVLLAFLVREYFVLATIVDIPIRGDIREYALYAWNLFHHGVFSMAEPQAAVPIPDAYRSPGYPWLLALCMFARPQGQEWYPLALQMQVVLGTATVGFTLLLAKRWLSLYWTIAAGLLLALWPHHIAATGALLSEVAFGFTLLTALYYFARAMESSRRGFLVLAAAVFGYAYLINPLIALFPPMLALLVWREKGRTRALLFAGIFLLPLLVFGLRNVQLDDGGNSNAHRAGRATVNFVQGSWPQYHQAWQTQRFGDPIGIAITQAISTEIATLHSDPRAGIAIIASRFATDPGYYIAWYLWKKPALLWDWNLGIGPGGVYFLVVRNSPLETHPLLHWCSIILHFLNPVLSIMALGGALFTLSGGVRRRSWAPPAALATAAIALYLTAVHTIFQAEPRYANAYRGIEVLLVMSFLHLLVATWQQSKSKDRAALNEP